GRLKGSVRQGKEVHGLFGLRRPRDPVEPDVEPHGRAHGEPAQRLAERRRLGIDRQARGGKHAERRSHDGGARGEGPSAPRQGYFHATRLPRDRAYGVAELQVRAHVAPQPLDEGAVALRDSPAPRDGLAGRLAVRRRHRTGADPFCIGAEEALDEAPRELALARQRAAPWPSREKLVERLVGALLVDESENAVDGGEIVDVCQATAARGAPT